MFRHWRVPAISIAAALVCLVSIHSSPTLAVASSPDPSSNPAAPSFALVPSGRLIVSANTDGSWNIYSADPDGGAWERILADAAQARDPAVSPNGKTIAFRSKLDGNWEIYSTPADGGAATRLTNGTVYSGAPVWSPDGKRIAFESYSHGDLDIWTMNADGSQLLDLTEDSKSYDYGPAWSPDGAWIAFTSWRTGTQQLYVVPADCTATCKPVDLSGNGFYEQDPAWSPDGEHIAFVSDRDGQRAIYVGDYYSATLTNIRRLTFSGWDDQPAWSPDGNWVAFVSARPTRQPIYIMPAAGGIPRIVANGPDYASSVVWTSAAGSADPVSKPDMAAPLYSEQPDFAAAGSGHPYELRRMTTTHLDPGINKLNSLVANSFVALQNRVKQEVGYDFLATLSDMDRPVDLKCDITCDTLSWHKAGRAFDSRLDYSDPRGIGGLEIVREDQQGETFWRVYLRAAAQDGTMGEPLKQAPWDLSYNARWIISPGQGGTIKPLPYGFYVDFTELAQQYGWTRISSHDNPDFDWKTNKIGAEYWHLQKTQGLVWYQAMRQIYTASDLKSIGDWNSLAATAGYDPYLLYLKGIPAPSSASRWSELGP